MKKIIAICISALWLSSCAFIPVHKMDIEQGNVINQSMVNQLHTGMSEDQVKEVLGTPMLLNTFNDNRVTYVYTFKPGNQPAAENSITLNFRNGRLVDFDRRIVGAYIK